jgi:hypothetical protein
MPGRAKRSSLWRKSRECALRQTPKSSRSSSVLEWSVRAEVAGGMGKEGRK